MNFTSQDYLAKLLAKENLTVQHGNYQTASFDVINRVLRLPLWKDQGKDVYDLLVGHEVGHALYTPADGWHDSAKIIPGVPRAYINIIEDIRIEKKIQTTYPGIVRAFKTGYKKLFDSNLFGTDDRDINKASFMDRVNVHSKSRGYLPVEFSETEQRFVDLAMGVETWEDVLNACREINEFVKNNEDYEDEDKEECSQGPAGEEGEDGEDQAGSMSSNDSGDEESDTENTEGQSGGDYDDEDDGDVSGSEEITDTQTDDAYRKNQDQLLEGDGENQPEYSSGISDVNLKNMVVPYSLLAKSRLDDTGCRCVDDSYENPLAIEDYAQLVKELKPTVNLMAKEFERKKAAWEYSRSSEAKKGSLNVNKLHQYQYSEDIFLTVQQLAQAKSHGVVMFVDWSGSMTDVIEDVAKQTIMIGMFCKKVNIPFVAYTWTTGKNLGNGHDTDYDMNLGPNEFNNTSNVKIVEVLSSVMTKGDWNTAAKHLMVISRVHDWKSPYRYGGSCSYDRMGSTPMIQTLIAAVDIVNDFKKKHGIQRLNVMLLTDGWADSIRTNYDREANIKTNWSNGMIFKIKNLHVQGKDTQDLTENTIKAFRKLTGANMLGFFLAHGIRDYQSAYSRYFDYDYSKYNKNKQEFTKSGVLATREVAGYSEYFIVKVGGKKVATEFEVEDKGDGIAIKDIKREFRKFNKNRKNSKQLVNKITDAVAA